jgi:glutathione gamma-glutamylcysteinyltransferase
MALCLALQKTVAPFSDELLSTTVIFTAQKMMCKNPKRSYQSLVRKCIFYRPSQYQYASSSSSCANWTIARATSCKQMNVNCKMNYTVRRMFSTCTAATVGSPQYHENYHGHIYQYDSLTIDDHDDDDDDDGYEQKDEYSPNHKDGTKHCQTCTCSIHDDDPPIHNIHTISRNREQHICQDDYQKNNLPLPPPLPEPKFSFHRRIMPSSLIQFSSPEGRRIFQNSLAKGMAEAFFPLSEQFLNQSDPAYCGITTLIMVLNAIGIDPNVRWKGGWRWYGSEDMILNSCCIHPERVKRAGILLEEFRSLGRCQGLHVEMKRPIPIMDEQECYSMENGGSYRNVNGDNVDEKYFSLDDFRKDIIRTVQHPPIFEQVPTVEGHTNNIINNKKHFSKVDENVPGPGKFGGFMVVSFSRPGLGQTGDGHFSPIAAYSEETDRCLLLDVARFKYPPYWVSVKDLYDSTRPRDNMTNRSRGWFLLYPPSNQSLDEASLGFRGTKTSNERMRPADTVPVADNMKQEFICPVGDIKVKYCSVNTTGGSGNSRGDGKEART